MELTGSQSSTGGSAQGGPSAPGPGADVKSQEDVGILHQVLGLAFLPKNLTDLK